MRYKDWQVKLDASEEKLLPLITVSLLCVQVLSLARNPIVLGSDLPFWLLLTDGLLLVLTAALVVWVNSRAVPRALAQPIAVVAYIMAGVSAIASIVAQHDPLPFYLAMVILAGSFCVLSQRYLLIGIAIIILLWAPAALMTLTLSQIVSTLLVTLVAAILSLLIMQRRILGLIKVYELETRVVALESILPMCANCKKTRDSAGNWQSIEQYIEDHQAGTQISHGSCPNCTEKLYGNSIKNSRISS